MSTKASKAVNKASKKETKSTSTVEKPVAKSETEDDRSKQKNATEKSENNTKNTTSKVVDTEVISDQQTESGSIFSARDQTILLIVFLAFTLIIWTIAPFHAQSNPNDVAAQ